MLKILKMFSKPTSTCPLSAESLVDFTGDVYYAFASDSTFTTWFTDLLWAPLMWYLSFCLLVKNVSFTKNRARVYGSASTLFIGVAAAMGVWHHALCYDTAQTCFLLSWGSCCLSIMLSGACCVLSALYLVTGDKISTVTQVLEAVTMGLYLYLGIINYFSHQPFLLIGLLGNVTPQVIMFFFATYHQMIQARFTFKSWLIYLGGFLIHMLGVYVNVITSAQCGSSCPIDCPLPVPYLNHNGFCHITEMLGAPFIFYAQKALYNSVEQRDGAVAYTKTGLGLEGKRKDTSKRQSWIPATYGDSGSHKSYNRKLGHTHDHKKD